MRLALIPGWNESSSHMNLLIDGRNGIPGLAAAGYECRIFDCGTGGLERRVEQFGAFVSGMKSDDGEQVGVVGYSAGGLIARGLLRAFPERADEIAGTFQLAAPNAGVVTDDVAGLLRAVRVSNDVIEDLDIESSFMKWLNGVGGHWAEPDAAGIKRWKLDGAPHIGPRGARITNLAGRVPKYKHGSDGIVLCESATLDDHVPHAFIDDAQANHLNLSGIGNLVTFLVRGWTRNDHLWPTAVREIRRFFSESPPTST